MSGGDDAPVTQAGPELKLDIIFVYCAFGRRRRVRPCEAGSPRAEGAAPAAASRLPHRAAAVGRTGHGPAPGSPCTSRELGPRLRHGAAGVQGVAA